MSKKLTLEKLLSLGVIPKGAKAINNKLIAITTVGLSKAKDPESEDHIGISNKTVVADDAEWVAIHKSGTFSCDKDGFIWKTSAQNKAITKMELVDNKLIPVYQEMLVNPSKIKNEGMDIQMTDEKNIVEKNLAGEVNDADALLNELDSLEEEKTDLMTSNNFSEDLTDEQKKELEEKKLAAAKKKIKDSITADTSGIKVGGLRDLALFNQARGRFYGYIMGSTPKIITGTKEDLILEGGMPVLVDDASADVKAAYASIKEGNKATIAKKFYKKHKVFNFRNSKPGSMLGLIFSMPAGGIVASEDIRSAEGSEVKFDKTKRDEVIFILPKDEAQTTIGTYFGGSIRESEKTHENPGVLSVRHKVQLDAEQSTTYRVVMSSSRGNFFTQHNWIPRKVNKTIKLEDAVKLDAKSLSDINRGCFGKLWDVPSDNIKQPTYYLLSAAEKAKVNKTEDGVYTSDFIKVGGSFPKVKAYYDSSVDLNTIELPIYEFKEKASEKGAYTSKAVQFDVLSPKPELADLDPQTDPRFAKIVSILPEGTTVKSAVASVITSKASNGGTSKRASAILTPEQTFALISGIAEKDSVNGFKTKMGAERVREYQDKIKAISFEV